MEGAGALGGMGPHPERKDSCGKERLVTISYSYSFVSDTMGEKGTSRCFMY